MSAAAGKSRRWAARCLGANNRDRGKPRGSAPPTPPYIRVRITAVRRTLSYTLGRDGREVERNEEGLRKRDGEGGAVTEPPRAMGAAGGLRRQIPADAAAP